MRIQKGEVEQQQKTTNPPIELEAVIELAHVKCTALPNELDIACPGITIVE